MKKGGSGGGRTKSGLYFEKNTDLKKAFILLDGFYSTESKIYYKNKEYNLNLQVQIHIESANYLC